MNVKFNNTTDPTSISQQDINDVLYHKKYPMTTIERLVAQLDNPLADPIKVLEEIKWIREFHASMRKVEYSGSLEIDITRK